MISKIIITLLTARFIQAAPVHGHGHLNCLAREVMGMDHHEFNKRAGEWGYNGKSGPMYWGNLDPAYLQCKTGKNQSPINIDDSIVKTASTPFVFNWCSSQDFSNVTFVNNGHTVEIVPPKNCTTYVTYNDVNYALTQFHFHVPGEHRIDGQGFLGEVHFVHQEVNGKRLVVLGLPLTLTDNSTDAKWLDFLVNVPKQPRSETTVPMVSMDGAKEALQAAGSYRWYQGSLTTPPCAETVTWFVSSAPGPFTVQQLRLLKESMPANSRPTNTLGVSALPS